METQQNPTPSSLSAAPESAMNASQTPAPSAPLSNTSGQYQQIEVPLEIKKWNWGAFLLNWIWGIGNSTYIAFLCFIPFVNIVMVFVLGAKGNEWAWKHRHWESVAQFKKVQRKWAIAGLIVWVVSFAAAGFGVAALVRATSGGVKNADAFFSDLSAGQVEGAYASTAAAFQSTTTLADFQSTVAANPILSEVKNEYFNQQDFVGNEATLKGTLTGNDGTVYPVTVYELKEDGQWKVGGFHLNIGQDGAEDDQ